MNLRLHHYLTILPLFLLLGAANAALSAWLDYREITDSLVEETAILQKFSQLWPQEELPLPANFVPPAATNAAERLAALEQTLLQRAIFFLLAALAAGLLVAEVLIRINQRELQNLQKAADRLADGLSDPVETGENIREYADLSSTLSTLSQILEENSLHTRTRLLHHDQRR